MRFAIVAILVFMTMFVSAIQANRVLHQCRTLTGNECKQCCGRNGYDADASVSSMKKDANGKDVEICFCERTAAAIAFDCKAALEAMTFPEKSKQMTPEKMLDTVNQLKAVYDKVPVSLESCDIPKREFISYMHDIGNVLQSNCEKLYGYDFIVEQFKREYIDWTWTGYLDFVDYYQKMQHKLCGE